MKNYVRIALITTALGTAANAAPFLAIGDGAELFVTGSLGVRVDDNIFLAQDIVNPVTKKDQKVDDTIFDIAPGVELTFGKNAALKGSLTLIDAFSNYSDNSDLNTNLASADFNTRFDDGKMKLKFGTYYHELNQNTVDNRALTRRDEFYIGGTGEVEVSQITSVEGGVKFTHLNYKRRGFGDSDDLSIPVNFYYKWTPKTDLSLGYRYRKFDTTVGADSTDNYFNVGARGEIVPKLTGQFTVGYTSRKTETNGTIKGRTSNLFGADSNFSYEVTPKTALRFGISNDYGTSPTGLQEKNFALYGNVEANIDAQWAVNAGLSYRSIEYSDAHRTDDYIEGTVGVNYIVNQYLKITGSYVHRNNSSDLASSEFSNNVFSIAASVRY